MLRAAFAAICVAIMCAIAQDALAYYATGPDWVLVIGSDGVVRTVGG